MESKYLEIAKADSGNILVVSVVDEEVVITEKSTNSPILVLEIKSQNFYRNLDDLEESDMVKKEKSSSLFKKLKIYYPEKLGRPFVLVAQHGMLNFQGVKENVICYLDSPIEGVDISTPENYPHCYY